MLLRYPGGKAKIYDVVRNIINANNFGGRIYCEAFAGGFGLGLKLMLNGDMERFIINDLDRHIYAFWYSVFRRTDELIERIQNTEITMPEWNIQKDIYENHEQFDDLLDVGFSTLFLNRTNFSGILTSGPIGGFNQTGNYKLNCRFNKNRIIQSIRQISAFRNNVEIYNLDVIQLIQQLRNRENEIFYNFDPPYVAKGPELYLNALVEQDHINLSNEINNIQTDWIMTYDNVELIQELYQNYTQGKLSLPYSVSSKRRVNELMISSLRLLPV